MSRYASLFDESMEKVLPTILTGAGGGTVRGTAAAAMGHQPSSQTD